MSKHHFSVRQTTLFTQACLWFLVGLAAARRVEFVSAPMLATSGACMLALFRKRSVASWLAVIIFSLLAGLARGGVLMQRAAVYQTLYRKPIVVVVQADNDAIYGNHGQLSFDATNLTMLRPYKTPLVGKLKVQGLGASMIYRGDRLQVSGSLSPTKGSAQARVSYAKLHVMQRGSSPIDTVRRRFIAGLQSVLPEPEASFGAGLLIGQRSTIPQDVNDQLSATGLTHLVAVSGYNLTIIIVAVRQVLGKRSKFQSTAAALLLMLVFILVTGFSASIVRAALVSSLSLLAWYYGRRLKPLLLISLAAAATAGLNPFYLWSDIGWYLSFFAFFGVLLVAPLLQRVISRGAKPKLIGGLLAETTAAQLLTGPIIAYIFGRVSVIGLLANVLVVPLVPLGMLLTLFAGLGGMVQPLLGGLIAWPSRLMLTYMIDTTALLSRWHHASVQHTLSLRSMLIAYFCILAITWLAHAKLPPQKAQNMVE